MARHAAAGERWRRALKAANSGRPVDLAELALAQDEYVTAGAELTRARHEDADERRRLAEARLRQAEVQSRLAVILSQEQRWRDVIHSDAKRPGLLARLRRMVRPDH